MKKTLFYPFLTIISWILIPTTVFCQSTSAGFNQILFLGINNRGAPALSKTYERMLRERLSTIPLLKVTDFEQTIRYKDYVKFQQYPTISISLLSKLQQILPDSIVLVWGDVAQKSISPSRKKIFGSVLNAQITTNLSIFNPAQNSYLFNGVIKSEKKFPGPWIYFASPQKNVLVNAQKRNELFHILLEEAAAKSASILSSIIQNKQTEDDTSKPSEDAQNNEPSISDVFSVPSVEAPEIDNSDETDSVDLKE